MYISYFIFYNNKNKCKYYKDNPISMLHEQRNLYIKIQTVLSK
jgi:hypothetical protein